MEEELKELQQKYDALNAYHQTVLGEQESLKYQNSTLAEDKGQKEAYIMHLEARDAGYQAEFKAKDTTPRWPQYEYRGTYDSEDDGC